MTIKLPMDVEIEMNTRLPYDFDDIIRKIFKEYLGEAKTENLDFNKLNNSSSSPKNKYSSLFLVNLCENNISSIVFTFSDFIKYSFTLNLQYIFSFFL